MRCEDCRGEDGVGSTQCPISIETRQYEAPRDEVFVDLCLSCFISRWERSVHLKYAMRGQ